MSVCIYNVLHWSEVNQIAPSSPVVSVLLSYIWWLVHGRLYNSIIQTSMVSPNCFCPAVNLKTVKIGKVVILRYNIKHSYVVTAGHCNVN